MWQNPEVALALHRSRVAEVHRRPRPRWENRIRPAAPALALRPAAAPEAR